MRALYVLRYLLAMMLMAATLEAIFMGLWFLSMRETVQQQIAHAECIAADANNVWRDGQCHKILPKKHE